MSEPRLIYDDSQLQRLFRAMDVKTRGNALRGAFRKEASRVRKIAQSNLVSSGLRGASQMKGFIRQMLVNRKGYNGGFIVSAVTRKANKRGKGEKGMHKNRRGLKKPILVWAERGTKPRRTKTRGQHSTGTMPAYRFMAKTLESERGNVTENIHRELKNSITQIARKYGCR